MLCNALLNRIAASASLLLRLILVSLLARIFDCIYCLCRLLMYVLWLFRSTRSSSFDLTLDKLDIISNIGSNDIIDFLTFSEIRFEVTLILSDLLTVFLSSEIFVLSRSLSKNYFDNFVKFEFSIDLQDLLSDLYYVVKRCS
jgi:hypothetical protein